MNKSEYQAYSRKLRVPQRCPLVGYCERWARTIYFFSYIDLWIPGTTDDNILSVLRKYGELPIDFDEKKVPVVIDPPEITKEKGYCRFSNFCPDVPLFQQSHCPGFVPQEAIISMEWEWPKFSEKERYEWEMKKCKGNEMKERKVISEYEHKVKWKEHRHYSECLEYIKNNDTPKVKSIRKPIPNKLRFEILARDNYRAP